MKIEQANLVIRSRGVAEVLDLALRYVFSLGGALYLKLWFVYCLPWLLALWGLLKVGVAPIWVWLLALILARFTEGVFTVAAGRLMFQRGTTFREVSTQFFSRLWSYTGGVLFSGFIYIGLILIAVLLPIIGTKFAYIHEAILLEGLDRKAAFARSGRMAQSFPGAAFGTWCCLALVIPAFIVVAEVVGQGVVSGLFQVGGFFGAWKQGDSLYCLIGFSFAVVYRATARFLSYIDLRTKHDAWDVQVRFMAIRAAAEGKS